MEVKTVYFEKPGAINTDKALTMARDRAATPGRQGARVWIGMDAEWLEV